MKTAVAIWLGVMVATFGVAAAAFAQLEKDAKGAADPIMRQLEAFRRDDYDTAYTFASAEIQQMFDRAAFERMVKGGYPEIARSTFALISGTEVAADGHAYLRVRIRGANGNSVEALYDIVPEAGGWRINGVVTKPDPGLV